MISWWESIDTVSRFNGWMQLSVFVFVVLAMISSILVWISGNRISQLQTQSVRMAEQRIHSAEKTSLVVHKELTAAEQKQFETEQLLKSANARIAGLQDRLKKAEKKQATAEAALRKSKLHQKTAPAATVPTAAPKPAALKARFREQLLKGLAQHPEGIVDIYAIQKDSRSKQLAEELNELFRQAGWTTNGVSLSTFSERPEGLTLALHSQDTAPSCASTLQTVFSKLGLAVPIRINSKYPEWSLALIVADLPASAARTAGGMP